MDDDEDSEDKGIVFEPLAPLGVRIGDLQGLAPREPSTARAPERDGGDPRAGDGGLTDEDWEWVEETLTERVGLAQEAGLGEVPGVLDAAVSIWGEEALGNLMDPDTGWEALALVLEDGLRAQGQGAWLDEKHGRGGQPLTLEEAGLHIKTDGEGVLPSEVDIGAARATRGAKHWWQRGSRA